MDRYSMFYDFEDVLNLKEHFDLQDGNSEYNFDVVTNFNQYYNIMYNHGFSNLQELSGYAMCSLNEFINEIMNYVEVEIYNRINFSCDYLQNYFETDEESGEVKPSYYQDAISYWEEYDDEINSDDEALFDSFVRNRDSLNLIFPKLLVYDKEKKILKVSKLCPNFGLYVFKNLGDMFWYGNNLKNNKDKFLVSRFLEVERCYFTDSEYYILEWLTNINSVSVISEMLADMLPTQKAKFLMDGTEESRLKNEIDYLIRIVSASSLTFSKALILKKLIEEANKKFDFQGEMNLTLKYIGIQFAKIAEIFESIVQEKSYLRFYKYLGEINTITSDDINRVECSNFESFKSVFLDKCQYYCNDSLIKNKKMENCFKGLRKAHKTLGYINVYVQKRFIYELNYAKKTDPLDRFVKA